MQTLMAHDVKIFGLEFSFDSVAFELPILGGWRIYWYGVCIALAFLVAVVYGFTRAKKFGIDPDRLTDVVLVTAPLAILCARLYYIIFDPKGTDINSFADFLGISGSAGVSGLAIYGAVIGAAGVGFLMCKLRKVNVLDAFDLAAICFLPAQAIGRWGNFFNQEAYGAVTGSDWWGMTSPSITSEMKLAEGTLVHPCFLYESVWCIIGFVLLHFLSKNRKFKGQMALSYFVWYGLGRMFIEGLRTDSLYWGPLRISQWLSGALVLIGGILLIVNFVKLKNRKIAETYESMFDDIDDTTVKTVYYEGDADETGTEAETETEAETAETEYGDGSSDGSNGNTPDTDEDKKEDN